MRAVKSKVGGVEEVHFVLFDDKSFNSFAAAAKQLGLQEDDESSQNMDGNDEL